MLKAMKKEDPNTQEYLTKMRKVHQQRVQQRMGQKAKENDQSAN